MLSSIFLFISGLGVLLFGIKTLGQGMQKITTGKIKNSISKFTKNRFQTFSFGTLINVLMQSSAASTVMTVGFVSTGLLSLFQGLGIIAGCNVGTSLITLLLSLDAFNIKEVFSCFCLVGVLMNFSKNQKVKDVGTLLLGFGLLFAGLLLISLAVDGLMKVVDIGAFITSINFPLLLILIGIVITILLQSSFAFIAILLTLVTAGSGLSLYSASFLIFGANIGTCATSLIVSLTTNANGKRTALFHLIFNIIGTIVFSLLSFTNWLSLLNFIEVPSLQLVIIDILFNVVTAIIVLPNLKWFEKLLNKIVKEKEEPFDKEWKIQEDMLKLPTFAIKNLYQNTIKLFELIKENQNLVDDCIDSPTKQKIDLVESNYQSHLKIQDILMKESVKITGDLSKENQQQIFIIRNNLRILERISNRQRRVCSTLDFNGKIIELTEKQKSTIQSITTELTKMFELCQGALNDSEQENNIPIFDNAETMLSISKEITKIKSESKQNIVISAMKSDVKIKKNTIFLGLLNDLDRLASYLSDMVVGMINNEQNETITEGNYEKISA